MNVRPRQFGCLPPDAPSVFALRPIRLIQEPEVATLSDYAAEAPRFILAQLDATEPDVPVSLLMRTPFRLKEVALHERMDCCAKILAAVRAAQPARRLGVVGLHEVSHWHGQSPNFNPRRRNLRAADNLGDLIDIVDINFTIGQDDDGHPIGSNLGFSACVLHLCQNLAFSIEQASGLWHKPVRVWISPRLTINNRKGTPKPMPVELWRALLDQLRKRIDLAQVESLVCCVSLDDVPGVWSDDLAPYMAAA